MATKVKAPVTSEPGNLGPLREPIYQRTTKRTNCQRVIDKATRL